MNAEKAIATLIVFILGIVQGMTICYMIYMPKTDIPNSTPSASLFAALFLFNLAATILFGLLVAYLSEEK